MENWLHRSTASTLAPPPPPPPHIQPRTHRMAWVVLGFLVLLRTAVSIFQNTFNPIPNVMAEFLNVNLTAINWLYNAMSVVYIIASFGTGWFFETLGVKKSLIVAGVLAAAGSWIRWAAVKMNPPSYAVLLIGQIIASTSCPLTLNIMTKFAAVWFTHDKRATAGMFVVSNYGGIIAMFLIPAVATGKSQIELTLLVVALICSVVALPQFFLPHQPPTPPSIEHRQNVSVLKSTVVLLKNRHFWHLSAIHGLNIGLSIAWGGLTNQAITPYGYSDAEAGNVVAVGIFTGALGCFVAGPMLDMTKQHKLFLKIMAPLMLSTYVALVFIVRPNSFAAILYVNALNQFFLSFMVPTVVELGVESTWPVSESISTSLLWQVAQIVGFVLVLVMDRFRDPRGSPPNNMFKALVFQAGMAGICAVLCLLYNGPMRRTNHSAGDVDDSSNDNEKNSAFAQTEPLRSSTDDSEETLRGVDHLPKLELGDDRSIATIAL